jgi:hypothetical protein
MLKAVRQPFLLLALVLLAIFAMLVGPVVDFGQKETITVPNVLTGEPMQLEVDAGALAEAEAAATVYWDCSRRHTNQGEMRSSGGTVVLGRCGISQGSGTQNGWHYVRDRSGPICIYYGSNLAGCASVGNWAYIGNRSGATATVRTQPLGS